MTLRETESPIGRRIFRQAALERLSTAEQLDQLVTITGPWTWLATLVIWLLLVGVTVWGFLGVIPDYVEGDGLLMTVDGAVFDVAAPASGRIAALRVKVGDHVKAGDVVATMDQSELSQDLEHARQRLAEREAHVASLVATFANERRIGSELRDKQRESLLKQRAAALERRDYLKISLDSLVQLGSQGLATRSVVSDTSQQFYQADQQMRETDTEIIRLDKEAIEQEAQRERELRAAREKLADAGREVAELEQQLARSGSVETSVGGRITEIKAPAGVLVDRGRAVLSLESGGQGLEAVVFVPSLQGKDVGAGLPVLLQPTNVKKEEFGSVEGAVQRVSEFPITLEGMRAILQNDSLIKQFSAKGAPYLVRISLARDPETVSGLKWTSGAGPDRRISAGSVVTAEITVRERAPITLVMPLLRKYTGLGY